MVVGKKDGKMIQFDQSLKAKKEIPAPDIFNGTNMGGEFPCGSRR